jgi:hypothetical protein
VNIDRFWSLIEAGKDADEPEEDLRAQLEALPPAEIVSFQEHFDTVFNQAYRWDLWGAAHLIEGGCSDDGFIDFRYALISRGRAVFERALKDPESLAQGEVVSDEAFGYVAQKVYQEKTGQRLPRKELASPAEPAGEEWDFDDDDETARRLPRLNARFSA